MRHEGVGQVKTVSGGSCVVRACAPVALGAGRRGAGAWLVVWYE